MGEFVLKPLPPEGDLESVAVLKQALKAQRFLAELKGVVKTIPNQSILINTLPLLEAKDSSAIENIITTHDALYKEDLFGDFIESPEAKEVQDYSRALKRGFELVRSTGLLTNKIILKVHACIEQNRAGFRKLPGTELKNSLTGKTVYKPPQHPEEIKDLMSNLEKYINDERFAGLEPLIKMGVIHFQFESIHPFYDGNGRAGRILNILYLVHKGLLDIPVLYLSRYIIETKSDYYRLLQDVRDHNRWEEWILYILKGIEVTSQNTIGIINRIKDLMMIIRKRNNCFKIYLLNIIEDSKLANYHCWIINTEFVIITAFTPRTF